MSHHRETVNADGAPAAVGPYVHAVRAGGLIFCSGQIALDPATGELVGADSVEEQAERALENLKIVCAAAGASLGDAVRMTVYLTDIEDFAKVNEVYARAFEGGEPPARTAYAVAALPKGAKVEIDAIVAVPD
ncbi:MAG TPA: Rid family detoxifying hydrolase [Solirubrobacteraceae bacterium]|jgi:2-iminobutanoate/2-iminopropanoate deaminase